MQANVVCRNREKDEIMDLSQYQDKIVRVVDQDGRSFTGIASAYPSKYGLHEFDREEESVKLNDYQLFESDIATIEELSGFSILRATETWQQAGAYYVRIQAMAKKHHIPLRQEFDEHDGPDTKYVVITDNDFPIATARMYPLDAHSKALGKLGTVVCLHFPNHKRRMGNQAEKELLGTVRTVFRIHLPECPARAFVLGSVLVVLVAVRHAIAGNKLHVDLHLLAWVFRPLIRLVLVLWGFFLGGNLPQRRSLETTVTAFVAVLACFLVSQQQVFSILLSHSLHQLYLPRFLRSRTSFRLPAPFFQASCASIPPFSPLPYRFSCDVILIRCLFYTMML